MIDGYATPARPHRFGFLDFFKVVIEIKILTDIFQIKKGKVGGRRNVDI